VDDERTSWAKRRSEQRKRDAALCCYLEMARTIESNWDRFPELTLATPGVLAK
jgi:hypothetical protein